MVPGGGEEELGGGQTCFFQIPRSQIFHGVQQPQGKGEALSDGSRFSSYSSSQTSVICNQETLEQVLPEAGTAEGQRQWAAVWRCHPAGADSCGLALG